ncbi:MAG: 3'-5' exonuclease, partial [Gammaproteobacteria bacterium]
PDAIDVMTMHKAKGLEFDVVILPGLHKGTGADDTPLLAWTRLGDREPGLVIAPVPRYDGDGQPLFKSLRRFERQRTNAEAARLLYVACTRARESLNLIASAAVGHDREGRPFPVPPASNTLLSWLWPVLSEDFEDAVNVHDASHGDPIASAPCSQTRTLKKLPLSWRPPARTYLSGTPTIDAFEVEEEPLEYVWARREARQIGTVVHGWLQRIAQDGLDGWNASRVAALEPLLRDELRELGVTPDALPTAAKRSLDALTGTLAHDRGRWILDTQHLDARNEQAFTAHLDGQLYSVAIDRTFVERTTDGELRWIIDYKTGSHSGGDVEVFLDREQERYRPQLERYARIVSTSDCRPIRLGLYFPLLRGWRAWDAAGA